MSYIYVHVCYVSWFHFCASCWKVFGVRFVCLCFHGRDRERQEDREAVECGVVGVL